MQRGQISVQSLWADPRSVVVFLELILAKLHVMELEDAAVACVTA